MPSLTTARPARARDTGTGALERRAITFALLLGVVALAAVSTVGLRPAALALATSLLVAVMAVIGRERTAVGVLMAAFASAPMAKGLAAAPNSPVTPTDVLVVLGVTLLTPTLVTRSLRLPTPYVVGVVLILMTGTVATTQSSAPFFSALQLVQWAGLMVILLAVMALWRPGWTVVALLLGSFVAGHVVSVGVGVVQGPFEGGTRYAGLTHHPNAFAEAGLMSVAALMYLYHLRPGLRYRLLVLVAAAVCVQSVLMSGSRAAAVVVAALVLLVPVVERSALTGLLIGVAGALFLLMLPFVIGVSAEGSALRRLAGSRDAEGADRLRSANIEAGWELFLRSPIIGNGFADVTTIHNLYLAVAAACGVIGLLGYLLVLFTLARPLFGEHPHRRLGYLAWAYVGLMATVPTLDNRTIWLPLSLAFLVALPRAEATRSQATSASAA